MCIRDRVIIGILVLIALPNLMPLISRAKATEAQQQLTYLHTLQRSNFYTSEKAPIRANDLLDRYGYACGCQTFQRAERTLARILAE